MKNYAVRVYDATRMTVVNEERRGGRVFFGVGEAEGWIGSSYEYLQIQGPS